ncbi:hypothetical protein ACFVR2_07515 [Gottfriedia sp. NPDC057991]
MNKRMQELMNSATSIAHIRKHDEAIQTVETHSFETKTFAEVRG